MLDNSSNFIGRKPRLIASITVAVLAYAGYSLTAKDLENAYFLLTDATRSLLSDPNIPSWTEMYDASHKEKQLQEGVPSKDEVAATEEIREPVASNTGAAPDAQNSAPIPAEEQKGSELPVVSAEFQDLARRRPVEYETVVKAFLKAFDEGRVVEMSGLQWSKFDIVR